MQSAIYPNIEAVKDDVRLWAISLKRKFRVVKSGSKEYEMNYLVEIFPNSKLSGEARFLKLGIPNFSSLEIQSKSMRYFLRFCLFNIGQYKLELHSIT